MDEIEPHSPFIKIGPNIYCVDGEWGPLKRRMTVLVLNNGNLVIHSAIQMNEEGFKKLEALGTVAYILVPNIFHNTDAPLFSRRYPRAQVFVPWKNVRSESKRMSVTGTLENEYPVSLQVELIAIPIKGIRFFETAFVHRASKTLILTDLVFNFEKGDFKGALKFITNLNKIGGGLGYSAVFKYLFLKNPKQFKESMDQIFKYDFENLVMSHGHIINGAAKSLLGKVFPESV